MKILRNTTATRLLNRFDNELKNILLNDLRVFASQNSFLLSKQQAIRRSTLSVAWPSYIFFSI
jgi:hypothetical protein